MTDEQLFDALDGLAAYDHGCVDSGIRDELLRERVYAYLHFLPEAARREVLARFLWQFKLSPEALARGYGPEDALEWLTWASEQGYL